MKNPFSLRTVFPSLAIAFCMIIFGGNVAAQTVGTKHTGAAANLDPVSGTTRISAATSVNSRAQ